jgi:hypothetical protein
VAILFDEVLDIVIAFWECITHTFVGRNDAAKLLSVPTEL